jgi:phage pi2 protein 07
MGGRKSLSSDDIRSSVFTPFLRRFTDEAAHDLRQSIALYEEVRCEHAQSIWAQSDIVERINTRCAEIISELVTIPRYTPLLQALDRCQIALIGQEKTIVAFPEIDWSRARLSMKEQVDLNRFLRAKRHFLGNQDRVFELMMTALCSAYACIIQELPPVPEDDNPTLTVPLLSLLPDPGTLIEKITRTLVTVPLLDAGLFTEFQTQVYENTCRASNVIPNEETKRQLISADESKLPPEELLETYLGGTPFVELFQTAVPFEIPQKTRFEHHWIIGGTGHGKTNAIGNLLIDDLQRVADNEASIVVIDSQNSLIPMLAHLPFFAEGGLLDGKLILIDASDVEYPVALNLFDVGLQRINSYSLLNRERLLNTAAEVMEFILQSLLGAEMTSRQSTLFGYSLQAMQLIPEATIHTFRELMQPNGRKTFAPYLANLQGRAREFFETQFDADIFRQTKQQVVARLFAICENRTFDRMLSNPQSKLDLFTEINTGKVILINTAKDLLKQQGTEIFGRFFLALIAQAAQERATLPASKRLPCFVYIDECQDYLSTDSNFTMILEQARKQNVGIIAAHQYVTQLSPKTLDSLYANTSIKFAGGVSDKDAHALARNMRGEPAFIAEQPRGSFAAFIRNTTKNAITLNFPLMPSFKEMTQEQYDSVLAANRAKYAIHYSQAIGAPIPSTSDAASLPPPVSKVTATLPQGSPSMPPRVDDDWRS